MDRADDSKESDKFLSAGHSRNFAEDAGFAPAEELRLEDDVTHFEDDVTHFDTGDQSSGLWDNTESEAVQEHSERHTESLRERVRRSEKYWVEQLTGQLEEGLPYLRILSIWIPVLGFSIVLSRTSPFRQLKNAKAVPDRLMAKNAHLRGRVISVDSSEEAQKFLEKAKNMRWDQKTSAVSTLPDFRPASFYFYHTPLLRDMLWFDFSRGLEHLRSKSIRCELAGIELSHEPAATKAFARLATNENVYIRAIAKEERGSEMILSCLLYKRKWFRREDIGTALVREGHAVSSTSSALTQVPYYSQQSRAILDKKFGKVVTAYERAEKDARRHRYGVWENLPDNWTTKLDRSFRDAVNSVISTTLKKPSAGSTRALPETSSSVVTKTRTPPKSSWIPDSIRQLFKRKK